MPKNKKFFILFFLLLFSASTFLFVSESSAAGLDYQLLEKIPGFASTDGSNLPRYIAAIYNLALAVIVLSAVLMLSIGGFMYLTSAGNTSAMGTAKGVIFDSLIGLVIALTAYLLLNVINPDLVTVTLNGLSAVAVPAGPPTAPPPTGVGVAGTCGGYAVRGISSSQCADASQALSDLLKCMYDKDPNTKVNSISDSAGFARCKTNWQQGVCAHAATSCHYGGGASQSCQKSEAVDLSTSGVSAQAIVNAASACGGRTKNEGNHIHVSTQTNCCTL
ncbi:MAG: pilin [Candidatus Moraniibacteriota bacterium]